MADKAPSLFIRRFLAHVLVFLSVFYLTYFVVGPWLLSFVFVK